MIWRKFSGKSLMSKITKRLSNLTFVCALNTSASEPEIYFSNFSHNFSWPNFRSSAYKSSKSGCLVFDLLYIFKTALSMAAFSRAVRLSAIKPITSIKSCVCSDKSLISWTVVARSKGLIFCLLLADNFMYVPFTDSVRRLYSRSGSMTMTRVPCMSWRKISTLVV